MKKTRFLSLALTGTLCVSLLAGCGGSGDGLAGQPQTPDAGQHQRRPGEHRLRLQAGRHRPSDRRRRPSMAWLPSAAPRSPWMKSKRPAATFSSR